MTYAAVLAVHEFRAMWLAELASILGDQLARVALAVLVYDRTASAGLTGLTYALSYLPSMAGGLLLSGLADRYPRRNVMVVADVARGVLVLLMAVPGTPLWLLCVLLAALTTLHGPFKAAQLALLNDVLEGESYTIGLAIRHMTIQAAQLAGFAGGGALIAVLSPSLGLALDALTFLVSAALVWGGVTRRPAPAPRGRGEAGVKWSVWKDPGLVVLLLLAWLCGLHVAPEALAAPYADDLGQGAVAVGILMAADPAGSVIGAFLFTRLLSEPVRIRLIGVLAVVAGIPLLFGFLYLPLLGSVALFAISGAFSMAYHTQLGASFARRLPDYGRARGLGVLSTGVTTVQGAGALLVGVVADRVGAGWAITLAGAAAVLLAIPCAFTWARLRQESPEPAR